MRTQKTSILVIFVIITLLTLLIVNPKSITNPFRIKAMEAVAPALDSMRSVVSLTKKIIPFASLREENRGLREKINLLNRKIGEMKVVQDENSRLRGMLEFKTTVPYSTIPAQVIGRDPSNWSNSIIINKGYSHGVRLNKAVLSTRGLVGRVVELGRYSSKILLITDPSSKAGVVVTKNRQGGILVGRPDGRCKVVYIALDSDVMKGDKVVTAGLGSIFPKDIFVGEVASVGKEPGRLYKYAIVETAQDLSKLEEVLCIR